MRDSHQTTPIFYDARIPLKLQRLRNSVAVSGTVYLMGL